MWARIFKFNPNHNPKTGEFASQGLGGKGFSDLDRALVDHQSKPDPVTGQTRSLSDPKDIRLIERFIEGAEHVPYTKTPFFSKLMEAQGTPGETDGRKNEKARTELFLKQPVEKVKISDLTFTQDVVNATVIARGVSRGKVAKAAFVVRYDKKLYVIDGHHSVINEYVHGRKSMDAHILDIAKVKKLEWAHVFKRNPFHDKSGKFTTKEKAGQAAVPLENWYKDHDDPNVTPDQILSQFTPAERGEIKLAITKANSTKSSKELYTDPDTGEYTKDRQKLHAKIIDEYLNGADVARATPAPGEKPTFVVLGGRGGSGKSSFTNGKVNEFDSKKFIVLDSDKIKEQLIPPYAGWNAASVHDESSDIFETITEAARKRGLNLVHDSTLRSMSMEKTVIAMKAKGYTVEGHYMFVPRQVSATRAIQRYLGKGPKERGRLVPVEVILGNTRNEQNFDNLKSHFSKWSAYDNTGSAPKLISRGDKK
jgi:predicted ABC-type ATPase